MKEDKEKMQDFDFHVFSIIIFLLTDGIVIIWGEPGRAGSRSRRLRGVWASVVAAHGFSCPTACGIFLDQ